MTIIATATLARIRSNMSELTEAEAVEFGSLARAYCEAKGRADYATSDSARAQLIEWGAMPSLNYTSWHPVFESTAHRTQRLSAREE